MDLDIMTDHSINHDTCAHTEQTPFCPLCLSCLPSRDLEEHRIIEEEDLWTIWGTM